MPNQSFGIVVYFKALYLVIDPYKTKKCSNAIIHKIMT